MARTTLAVQTISRDGITPSFTAANVDGHEINNSGRMFLYVKNGDASPITVTIVTPGTVDGLAVADKTVTVPATDEEVIGPFPPQYYNQAPGETDTVFVDFSAVTSVTIAALVLPAAQ